MAMTPDLCAFALRYWELAAGLSGSGAAWASPTHASAATANGRIFMIGLAVRLENLNQECRRVRQTENDVPQPQEDVAFGLLTLKLAPMRSSAKSISAPFKKSSDTGSIKTVAPSRSRTRSSSCRLSSSAKLY